MMTNIESYSIKSNMFFDKFIFIRLHMYKFVPLSGASYIELPKWI
jgi:hypothetical protein